MLSTTQLLIFEIGSKCNFGHIHNRCPNMIRIPTSKKELTDDIIIKCIEQAYTRFNFTGLIGWHYHNEPMLESDRIFTLMEKYPTGRYVLWTNGSIQPEDNRIKLFERVYCSDYGNGVNKEYYNECKYVKILTPRFDNRLDDTNDNPINNKQCYGPYVEFILDNWGVAHLCCQDWKGEILIGNIWDDSFESLVTRRHAVLKAMFSGDRPERCMKCRTRRLSKYDNEIYTRTLHHIEKEKNNASVSS